MTVAELKRKFSEVLHIDRESLVVCTRRNNCTDEILKNSVKLVNIDKTRFQTVVYEVTKTTEKDENEVMIEFKFYDET